VGQPNTRTQERSVAIVVPVLGRPDRVAPLVRSLDESVAAERRDGWQVELVFVCSPDDELEVAAVRAAGLEPLFAPWPAGRGDYARKINHAANLTDATWIFTGADDLRFLPGWLRAAISVHIRTGALVIGTNDLGNPAVMRGQHATHSLVHRDYLEHGTIDEPGVLLHEGYGHCWVDNEFVETARARGVFAFAKGSQVEHLHPIWHKAADDVTYRRGQESYRTDQRLFVRRRQLWARRTRVARSVA
jgi:hypothetical protein